MNFRGGNFSPIKNLIFFSKTKIFQIFTCSCSRVIKSRQTRVNRKISFCVLLIFAAVEMIFFQIIFFSNFSATFSAIFQKYKIWVKTQLFNKLITLISSRWLFLFSVSQKIWASIRTAKKSAPPMAPTRPNLLMEVLRVVTRKLYFLRLRAKIWWWFAFFWRKLEIWTLENF